MASLLDSLPLKPPPEEVWTAPRTGRVEGSGTESDSFDGRAISSFNPLRHGRLVLRQCGMWLYWAMWLPWAIIASSEGLAAGYLDLAIASVFIPEKTRHADGNAVVDLPFAHTRGPVRYQQVYAASAFSNLPPGGALLTRIFFRADCGSSRVFTVTNLQVNLSTTSRGPDDLSSNFVENIGSDDTVVFSSKPWFTPGSGGCTPTVPIGFQKDIVLDLPFFYNPARGNLLLDLRNWGLRADTNPLDLPAGRQDAQDEAGDPISRVAALSLQATSARFVDTLGLVTLFTFFRTPPLTIQYETNTVVITWGNIKYADPDPFRLQWTDTIGSRVVWTDYPGPVEWATGTEIVRIPTSSLRSPKFFRLLFSTPQPIPTSPAEQDNGDQPTR